ncbi:MAG: hypothetical protein ACK4V6_10170 [Microthrixaceae bacterium]
MSETLLIFAGVAVFTVTVVGTLWYFYLLLMGLDGQPDRPVGLEVQPGADIDNA